MFEEAMALPAPAPRQHFHTRRINCQGFSREDGLWDIEAHLTDVKSYGFDNEWRGEIAPGAPIHEMWLRLTLDDDFHVVDVEAFTENSPFEMCPAITPNFKRLIGLKIGPGWNKRVREKVGGVHGCTHLAELLGPMATVAYQTIPSGVKRRAALLERRAVSEADVLKTKTRPHVLNTCHAWASDSPVVKRFAPEFYQPGDDKT